MRCQGRSSGHDPVRAFRHGPRIERARQIAANARRLEGDAFHCAVALDLCVPLYGRTWIPICCWCFNGKVSPSNTTPDEYVFRIGQHAGGCSRCPYFGPDTLVASILKEVL